MFNEGHVVDTDGRQWHYTGTDGSIQGPFSSSEMNAWRKHGFFSNDDGISMRLAVPVQPQMMAGGGGGGGRNLWGNGLNREAGGRGIMDGSMRAFGGPASDLSTKNKLFVGGLDPTVNDDMFGQYFSRFGNVVNAHVMKDRETGHSRGFGFITFAQDSGSVSLSLFCFFLSIEQYQIF
jgi:hypothetical protein